MQAAWEGFPGLRQVPCQPPSTRCLRPARPGPAQPSPDAHLLPALRLLLAKHHLRQAPATQSVACVDIDDPQRRPRRLRRRRQAQLSLARGCEDGAGRGMPGSKGVVMQQGCSLSLLSGCANAAAASSQLAGCQAAQYQQAGRRAGGQASRPEGWAGGQASGQAGRRAGGQAASQAFYPPT